jgi:phosphinothricin acetyltransferase
MPQIRSATEADFSAITAITNEAIVYSTAVWHVTPTTLEARISWWQDRMARGFPVLVATAGDAEGAGVLGFASYGDFRPFAGYAATVEHSIYVDPQAQGRGIGSALLAALIDHAAKAGLHVMVGGIEAGNAASVALHRKAGFVEAGTLREVGRKFDRWLDLLFMTRRL